MLIEKSKFIILIFIIIFVSSIGFIFLYNPPVSTELSNNQSQPNREPIVKPEQKNEEIEPIKNEEIEPVKEAVEERILNPDEIIFPEPEPIITSDSLVIPMHSGFTLIGKSNQENSKYCNELIEIKTTEELNYSIQFGMANNYRCSKSIIVFDLTTVIIELSTKDIKSLDIRYQGKKPYVNCGNELICSPPPFAEIKYELSNVPCVADSNNDYFNNKIENWTLLVREYWVPLSADWVNSLNNPEQLSNHTDWKALSFIANDIEKLGHDETSYFLCMSLSQYGDDLIGHDLEHNLWSIQDPILILSWI